MNSIEFSHEEPLGDDLIDRSYGCFLSFFFYSTFLATVSLGDFETPVCTPDGVVFDILNVRQ